MSLFGRRPKRRFEPIGDSRFAVRLPDGERALLAGLAGELRELLSATTDDPVVRRLFPTAYHDDAERDREYHALVRDELLDRRLAAIEALEGTAEATEVGAEELNSWMAVINDLRLVLGTKLDVSEDMAPVGPDHPEVQSFAVYEYLAFLLDEVVDALSEDLPPPTDDDPLEA